jgi:hypothetical protein
VLGENAGVSATNAVVRGIGGSGLRRDGMDTLDGCEIVK